MSSSKQPGSRLMRWLQREPAQPQAQRTPDPADMGTCFGLDLSLDDSPVDPFAKPPARALRPAQPELPFTRTSPGTL